MKENVFKAIIITIIIIISEPSELRLPSGSLYQAADPPPGEQAAQSGRGQSIPVFIYALAGSRDGALKASAIWSNLQVEVTCWAPNGPDSALTLSKHILQTALH